MSSSYFPSYHSSSSLASTPLASYAPTGAGSGPTGAAAPPPHRRTVSEMESSDIEALEKECFDLKLRLYYLEEKTKAGLPLPQQLYQSLMTSADLQSALTAAEAELETKNGLLVKARSVIEALTSDVQNQKAQFAHDRSQLQSEVTDRVNATAHSFESQMIAMRHQVQESQAHKLQVDEEMQQLRLVLQQMENVTAQTASENSQLTDELRRLALQLSEKEAASAQQAEVSETQLRAITDRSVSKEDYDSLHHRYSALESEMVEWRSAISSREVTYQATSDQLQAAMQQVEEMRLVQVRLDESQARVLQLEAQLASSAQDLSSQQSHFDRMLQEDDRRLSEAFQAERTTLIDAHQRQVDTLVADHAARVQSLEESNRANFAELQDVYNRQLMELRAQHEEEAARRHDEERTRTNEMATRMAEMTSRFEQEMSTQARAHSDQLQRLQEEQEATRAQESHTHSDDIAQLHLRLQEADHRLASAVASHSQARTLWEQSAASDLAAARKDIEQRDAIHQIHTQRAEEKLAEVQSQKEREVADALAAVREKTAADVDQARDTAKADRAQLESQMRQQQEEFRSQHEQVIASIEQQWKEKESGLRADAEKAHEAQLREADNLRRVLRSLRGQVDHLESVLASEFVPLTRHTELARRESSLREEVRTSHARIADLRTDLERTKIESVAIAKFHEVEDALERSQAELRTLQQRVHVAHTSAQAQSQAHTAAASTMHSSTTSPILHLSMYPTPTHSALSSSHAAFSTPAAPLLRTSPSPSQVDTAAPTWPAHTMDLTPTLRKLQAENRALTMQVAALKRHIDEEVVSRDEEFVDRQLLVDAQEEITAITNRLHRRDADVRHLRDLLGASESESSAHSVSPTHIDGVDVNLRDLALGSGVHISSLAPTHSDSSRASKESHALPARQAEDLAHEVARLTRALQARTEELSSLQSRLRESKSALREARESMVDRSVVTDLESQLEGFQRDASLRDGHISSLTAALQSAETALIELRSSSSHQTAAAASATDSLRSDLQRQLDDVQQEAADHVRRVRHEFDSVLSARDREMESMRERHESEVASLSRARDQLLASHTAELESLQKEMAHAHTSAIEHAGKEAQMRLDAVTQAADESRHRLEELLSVEKAHSHAGADDAAARRAELESSLASSRSHAHACEEEKQRTELLVATISQQMVELANVISSDDLSATAPTVAFAEPPLSAPVQGPTAAAQRRPSPSPPRTAQRALFSPDGASASRSVSRGRTRPDSSRSPLFQQPYFVPATPFGGVAAHSSPHASPLTLPMSPEHIAAGSVASVGVAALSVAPHVSSITHSMQTIFARAQTAQERLREANDTIIALQHEIDAQSTSHRDESVALESRYAALVSEVESLKVSHDLAVNKEKDAFFAQIAIVHSKAERDVAKLEEQLDRAHHQSQQSLAASQQEWKSREQDLTRARDRLDQEVTDASRALDVRAREVETLKQTLSQANDALHRAAEDHKQSLAQLHSSLQSSSDRLAASEAACNSLEEAKSRLEHRIASAEASLQSAPTSDAVLQLRDRLHSAELEKTRLESSVLSLNQRLQDAEAERTAHMQLRLAHAALEQSHEKMISAQAIDADEKRDLQHQLDRARAFESDNAMLLNRLQQAEKRTQAVGAGQQLHVQVTRRVLMELCEVLHAAKIPASSKSHGRPRAHHHRTRVVIGAALTPNALYCPFSFTHFPSLSFQLTPMQVRLARLLSSLAVPFATRMMPSRRSSGSRSRCTRCSGTTRQTHNRERAQRAGVCVCRSLLSTLPAAPLASVSVAPSSTR